MLMNRIRNVKSKYRILAIIVVLILTVGLVGAFGIGSSPSLNNSSNNSDEDATQAQINALLTTIGNEKSDTAEKGYTENNQLAEDLYKLAGLYGKYWMIRKICILMLRKLRSIIRQPGTPLPRASMQ